MNDLKRLKEVFGTPKGWECTDDGCLQYRHQESEDVYYFISMEWLDATPSDEGYPDKCYIVGGAKVDLEEEDYEMAICGYYDSLKAMQESCGLQLRDLKPFIAECAYENIPDPNTSYAFMSEIMTKVEAEELILSYVEECNGTLPHRICKCCGHPVFTSPLKNMENGYPFQCFNCDEDLYTFETQSI